MKKVVCFLLSIILILSISTPIFAENENTDINDEQTPGSNQITVEGATYNEPNIIINNEDIPAGESIITPGLVEIEEQSVPAGLPNTGGIPAEAFYVAGALFVAAALILTLKKDKARQEN